MLLPADYDVSIYCYRSIKFLRVNAINQMVNIYTRIYVKYGMGVYFHNSVSPSVCLSIRMSSLKLFPPSGDFYRLLLTFANSLDPDQARQNVGPDLDPNCLTL